MGHRRRHHRCLRRLPLGLITLVTLVAALTGILAGCSISRTFRPDSYTVARGDTLYSIAQEYGVDWHDLARWNEVGPPYRIDVGRRLSLDAYPALDYSRMESNARGQRVVRAPQDSRVAQNRSINASTTGAAAGNGQNSGSGDDPYGPRPLARQAPPTVASQPLPGAARTPDRPAPAAPPGAPARSAASQPRTADDGDDPRIDTASHAQTQTPPVHVGGPSEDGWQWPVSGAIIRAYAPDKSRQGIEIGGRVGAPVYAASSGRVVYSGSGLKGYGRLIIIKHDKHYLSAYGFNRRTQVKQGQNIAAGAHIADMGLGPGNKPMLHFEIRKDGAPVNPEGLLPAQ